MGTWQCFYFQFFKTFRIYFQKLIDDNLNKIIDVIT